LRPDRSSVGASLVGAESTEVKTECGVWNFTVEVELQGKDWRSRVSAESGKSTSERMREDFNF
jgi:hypothetical protein